jgi:hypothetical protein
MSLTAKMRRAPLRLAAGAFILNSGLSKRKADEAHAKGVHGMAAGAYPFVAKVDPRMFVKGLSLSETALGAMLLLPVLPAGLVGLGLTAFSAGLLGLYVRTPSLHDKYLRPTQAGIGIAKDSWLAAIAVALVVDAALSESPVTRTEPSS